jgi:hypothetical protein
VRPRRVVSLFIAGVLVLHLVFFVSLRQRIARGYPDFTVFYTAAKILRAKRGHGLYTASVQNQVQKAFTGELPSRPAALPYIHPPFEALFFLPLSRLPYLHAYSAWDLLNIGMLFALALLLRASLAVLRLVSTWEFVLAALAFFPIFECLLQGQDSVLQLLLCTLAWRAMKKRSDILAGCWFGLGAFKFQLMIPIVILVTLWQRRRVLIGFSAVLVVLSALSLALVGWQGLLQYPDFALHVASAPALGGVPADFLPNLHGLIMGWPFRLAGARAAATIVLASAGLFLFAATTGQSRRGEFIDLRFSIAVAVAELIGWQTNIHDYSLLLLPFLLVANHCLNAPPGRARWKVLYPVLPILISPLWLLLWLWSGHVNLFAIPLLWWVWELSRLSGVIEPPSWV